MVRWRRTFCSACLLMWRNTVQWLTHALWWRYEKKCALAYVAANRISEGIWAYRIIDCGAAKDIYQETRETTSKLKLSISLFHLNFQYTVNLINVSKVYLKKVARFKNWNCRELSFNILLCREGFLTKRRLLLIICFLTWLTKRFTSTSLPMLDHSKVWENLASFRSICVRLPDHRRQRSTIQLTTT